MGQLIPRPHSTGPNVICIIEYGGGQRCDCDYSSPHFDTQTYDQRLFKKKNSIASRFIWKYSTPIVIC